MDDYSSTLPQSHGTDFNDSLSDIFGGLVDYPISPVITLLPSQQNIPNWQSEQELANLRVDPTSEHHCEPLASSSITPSRRRYGPEIWTQFQPIIRDIYLIQGRTLKETQRILEEQYTFQASKKQLKDRVKKWGFVKNKKGKSGDSRQKSSSLEPENELEEDSQGNPRNPFNRFDSMTSYAEAAAFTDA